MPRSARYPNGMDDCLNPLRCEIVSANDVDTVTIEHATHFNRVDYVALAIHKGGVARLRSAQQLIQPAHNTPSSDTEILLDSCISAAVIPPRDVTLVAVTNTTKIRAYVRREHRGIRAGMSSGNALPHLPVWLPRRQSPA